MTVDSCFQFGKIIKPHGLKGELAVTVTTDHVEHLKNVKNIFLSINDRLVPFFIEKFTVTSKTRAILKLEDVNSESEADTYSGISIFLPLTLLPPLGKNQFYYHEVIDYMVLDNKLGAIGTIAEIYEMPGQDLIAVQYHNTEVLIPISEQIVIGADHALKTVYVELPEGLLDMYTDQDDEPHEN